jgi:hypothetical protein
MKYRLNHILFLLALGNLFMLNACKDPEYPTPEPVTSPTTLRSRVLVVNAAPDAGSQEVQLDNVPVGTVPYLGVLNNGYVETLIGPRQLRVKGVAKAANSGNTIDLVTRPTLNATNYNNGNIGYTFFITDVLGRANTQQAEGGLRFLQVTDNLSAPRVATNAKVRFLHLSPDAPAVGVYNTLTNAEVFAPRAYRATSAGTGATAVNFANFTEIPAGTYSLDVRANAASAPVLVVPPLTFEAGKIYTVYAHGLLSGTGPQALGASVIVHN